MTLSGSTTETVSAEPTAEHPARPTQTGIEWVVDAFGCDPSRLRDLRVILSVCDDVVDELGLHVVGDPHSHKFPGPGGVTAMYLLSESHLTCHTYPEYELATFNLYCCRERDSWAWQEELQKRLNADSVQVRTIARGVQSDADAAECKSQGTYRDA